jgi:hypothetical protein
VIVVARSAPVNKSAGLRAQAERLALDCGRKLSVWR